MGTNLDDCPKRIKGLFIKEHLPHEYLLYPVEFLEILQNPDVRDPSPIYTFEEISVCQHCGADYPFPIISYRNASEVQSMRLESLLPENLRREFQQKRQQLQEVLSKA